MEDLSGLAGSSLATDSMHAGNQIWKRDSMSAPGGDDLGNFGRTRTEQIINEVPRIDDIKHTRTTLHPEAPPANKSPFPRPPLGGPARWVTSSEPDRGPAPWDQT